MVFNYRAPLPEEADYSQIISVYSSHWPCTSQSQRSILHEILWYRCVPGATAEVNCDDSQRILGKWPKGWAGWSGDAGEGQWWLSFSLATVRHMWVCGEMCRLYYHVSSFYTLDALTSAYMHMPDTPCSGQAINITLPWPPASLVTPHPLLGVHFSNANKPIHSPHPNHLLHGTLKP